MTRAATATATATGTKTGTGGRKRRLSAKQTRTQTPAPAPAPAPGARAAPVSLQWAFLERAQPAARTLGGRVGLRAGSGRAVAPTPVCAPAAAYNPAWPHSSGQHRARTRVPPTPLKPRAPLGQPRLKQRPAPLNHRRPLWPGDSGFRLSKSKWPH